MFSGLGLLMGMYNCIVITLSATCTFLSSKIKGMSVYLVKSIRIRDLNFNQTHVTRLIPVVVVVITLMNPYQPIPFHILSSAVFQSRILIYAGSNISEEEKVFDRNDRFSQKTSVNIDD